MVRIAQRFVEVDDRVEGAAVADPGVDRLALGLALRGPGAGKKRLVLERRQGAAEHLDAACLGTHRELLQAGDHLLGRDLLVGLGPAVAEVVGAEHHDRVGDAGLDQDVAVEATQAAVAPDVVQDPVAAEPLVHDRHRAAAGTSLQPARELIGPAAERVDRRDVGVGQRVAERHDAAGLSRGEHVDAADEIPVVGDLADRHRDRRGEVPRR